MKLTEPQNQAIQSVGDTLVIASAGTGKTSVLTKRILHALEHGLEPSGILAFTFTEKAASEMRTRITKTLKNDLGLAMRLDIGTLHAYCRKLLTQHARRLGLNPKFQILNEKAMNAWLEQEAQGFIRKSLSDNTSGWQKLLSTYGYWHLAAVIPSLCKPEPNPSTKRSLLLHDDLPTDLQAAWQNIIEQALQIGEASLQKRLLAGTLNFDDLILLTLRLLESHTDVLHQTQSQISLLLIDECQDMAPNDIRLIECLHKPGKNHLFAVGDPKQSIYAFRQADAKLFEGLKTRVLTSGGQTIALDSTFRTPKNLQENYNAIFTRLFSHDDNLFAPMQSNIEKSLGGLYSFTSETELEQTEENSFIKAICTRLKELQVAGWPLKDIAILCPKQKPLYALAESLRAAGLAVQTGENPLILLSPLARTTFHILASLSGLKEPLVDYGINAWPTLTPDWLKTQWPVWEDLATAIYADELAKVIASDLGGSRHALDESALTALVDLLSDRIDDTPPYLQGALPILRSLYQKFTLSTTLAGNEIDAVNLLTVHKAKGLEFAQVFLIPGGRIRNKNGIIRQVAETNYVVSTVDSVSTALKPVILDTALMEACKETTTKQLAAETRRLLYVALTRTYGDVHIVAPPPTKELTKLFAKNPNPILVCDTYDKLLIWLSRQPETRLWESFAVPTYPQTELKKTAPCVTPSLSTSAAPLHISVTQLEVFHDCPARYHLQYVKGLIPFSAPNSSLNKNPQTRDKTIDAITRGRFIHEILEFTDFVNDSHRETVIAQALQNQQLTDPHGELRELGQKVLQGLKNNPELLALFINPMAKKEIAFTLKFEHFLLEGKIDHLNVTPPVIIDYKTHNKPPAGGWAELASRYDFQMNCYALAVAEVTKAATIETVVLFTTGAHAIRRSIDKKFLSQFKADLDALYLQLESALRSGQFPLTKDSLICKRCPFFEGGACGIKQSLANPL